LYGWWCRSLASSPRVLVLDVSTICGVIFIEGSDVC
jgi:hypothetical protein